MDTSRVLSQLIAGEIKCVLLASAGRGLEKVAPGFLWPLPQVPLPFADFASHPFTVINHSPDYAYVQSPVSPPSELSHVGWSRGLLPGPQESVQLPF